MVLEKYTIWVLGNNENNILVIFRLSLSELLNTTTLQLGTQAMGCVQLQYLKYNIKQYAILKD